MSDGNSAMERTGKRDRKYRRQKDYNFLECLEKAILITLEYKPERKEGVSLQIFGKRAVPAKGTAALRSGGQSRLGVFREQQGWRAMSKGETQQGPERGGLVGP